jgi:hypothetical protein
VVQKELVLGFVCLFMTFDNFPVVTDGSPAHDAPIQSTGESHMRQDLTVAEETGILGLQEEEDQEMVPAYKLPHEGSLDATPPLRDLEALLQHRLLLSAPPHDLGPAMRDAGVWEGSALSQVAPTPQQSAWKAASSGKKRKRAADLESTLLKEAIKLSCSFAAAIEANIRDKQMTAAAEQSQDYREPYQCDQAARQRVEQTRMCYWEFISLAKERNQVSTFKDHPSVCG